MKETFHIYPLHRLVLQEFLKCECGKQRANLLKKQEKMQLSMFLGEESLREHELLTRLADYEEYFS